MESLLEHLLTRGRRALATWIAGAALLGCSAPPNAAPLAAGDDEATTNDDRTSSARADGRCEDWATIDCGIELETHGGLIDCARGVRLCQDGRYGPCIADASLGVVSVQAPEATLPDDVHQGLMAVGGVSTRCSDNPCNPYCQTYVDTAPTPYQAPRLDTPTGDLSGGSLQSSNLPSSFKNKGSLDAQCSSAVGSQAYNEACQFDQHCVGGACTAFEPGESGNCTGVDITAPTTCVPSSGETRALTVCNRGSETAPAGIKCYGYPGGSPQYPNSDPGLSNKLLMTTQGSLAAGECETQQIDENIFGQNGIQSVACNPPEISTTTSTLTAYPSSNATTSGSLPWLNPERGYSADGSDATATPANPSGASTGSVYPTANASFQADAPWDEPTKAYSA